MNRHAKQTVAKNTFWLLSGEIVSRVFRAAIIIYAARALGKEGLGVFSYVITLASFFTIFSDIGLSAILTRETAKDPDSRHKYLSTAFFIKIFLAGLLAAVSIFAAPHLAKDTATATLIPLVSLILIFDGLREFGFSVNRAMEKMELEAVAKIIANFAIIVFSFGFLAVQQSPAALVWGYVAGSGVGFLYSVWTLRHEIKNIFCNFTRSLVWPIFSSAWPFALSGFLGGIMINTDTIMLGWLRSIGEVGIYSAAQKPAQLFYVIPAIFSAAIFPMMAKMAKKDNEGFRRAMEKAIRLMAFLAFPIAAIGTVFSREAMVFLFGSEYLPGVSSLQILLCTLPIVFTGLVVSNALFAYDEQKKFIGYLVLGALSNVVLDYFLIKRMGIPGCAIATLLAQIISNAFLWLAMKRVNDFSVIKKLKTIFLATGTALGFSLIFKMIGFNFLVGASLAAVAYLFVLFFKKEPVLKDIKEALK